MRKRIGWNDTTIASWESPCRHLWRRPRIMVSFVISKGNVTEFLQKPSPARMKETPCCVFNENQAWIDTGVVAFLGRSATALWQLSSTLDACTERGLRRLYQDEASPESQSLQEFARQRALRVELYTHMMMASSFPSFEAYNQACGNDGVPLQVLQNLYSTLSSFPLQAIAIPQGTFTHLGTSRELLEFYFGPSQQTVRRAHAFLPVSSSNMRGNQCRHGSDKCLCSG